MRPRVIAILAGLLLLPLAIMLMAPTGGFPSRPRFQAATVGAGTVAGTGDVRINAGSLGVGTAPNAADGRITITGELNAISGGTTAFLAADSTSAYFGSRTANAATIRTNDVDRLLIDSAGTAVFLGSSNEVRNTSPYWALHDTGQAVNTRMALVQYTGAQFLLRYCNDAISACTNFLTVSRTGGTNTAPTLNLAATAITANGSTVWTAGNDGAGSGLDADTLDGISSAGFAQETTGTFTGNVNGCSAASTISFRWTKLASIVVLEAESVGACTSNTTGYTITDGDFPAAIRPASNICTAALSALDNGGAVFAAWQVNTAGGAMLVNQSGGGAGGCVTTNTWTASGTKRPAPHTITYSLN